MPASIPSDADLEALLGRPLFEVWTELCAAIDGSYDMERLWNQGGKAWDYEYKYRRGGKTLCALYARNHCVGFLIVFGKDERSKFEAGRAAYAKEIQAAYDDAKTYHDGKWVMFQPVDASLFEDFIRLLGIKRKPNKA